MRRDEGAASGLAVGGRGLVSSSTSGTAPFVRTPLFVPLMPGETVIDADAGRVQRLRRRVFTVSRLHCEALAKQRSYPAMVTLTYREGVDWCGTHMSSYIRRVRAWWNRLTDRPLRYVWVAELQKRGAVHYHVIFWLPAGFTMPKADKRGWWQHGSTRTEAARFPVAYLAKYASKVENTKGFPDGCRLHGNGGLRDEFLAEARWWALPGWARALVGVACGAKRRRSGGGLVTAAGLSYPSPWRVAFFRGETVVRQAFSYLEGIRGQIAPYSRWPVAASPL